MKLKLFHYWRSSSSWRVRLALAHKKIASEFVHVDLLNGESDSQEHLSRNPLGYVPALEADGKILIQSMAIIEWLDEMQPDNKMIFGNPFQKAHIRALCETINADTQPIQNVPVVDFYSKEDSKRVEWIQYFVSRGLEAYEKLITTSAGKYSVGNDITAADFFLIPQCYNALRYEMNLEKYPKICKINQNIMALEIAKKTHPDQFKP